MTFYSSLTLQSRSLIQNEHFADPAFFGLTLSIARCHNCVVQPADQGGIQGKGRLVPTGRKGPGLLQDRHAGHRFRVKMQLQLLSIGL